MCASQEDGLRWDSVSYGKHVTATTRAWDRSWARRFSAAPGSHAQYNPWISRETIESIEMDCAREKIGEPLDVFSHCRTFCYTHDIDIGVSKGQFTRHIIVYRQSNGSVHGYPIPEFELNEKKRKARKRREKNDDSD